MLETAPAIAKQHVGRTAMMYKGFGVNLYSTMLQSLKTALDSEQDSEVRKIATKQLLGVHASALAFSGVAGVPIYGAVSMIADMLFYDDEEDDFDTNARKFLTEGWYKGWFAELSGIDVSYRIKLTDLLWEENKYKMDASAEESFMALALGPAGSVLDRTVRRGIGALWEGGTWKDMERGIENIFPPAISNAYKSTFGRYQREGGMYTRAGNPIYDDITGGELAFQALGFAPTGYTFEQERNNIISGIDKAVGKKRSSLMKRYHQAMNLGSVDEIQDALEDIWTFNSRVERTHPSARITGDKMMKSIKARERTVARTHNGVAISPLMYETLMLSRGEWGN